MVGEGSSRYREPDETDDVAHHRNTSYATLERLAKSDEFFQGLEARKFHFVALFGVEAGKPFAGLVKANREIVSATVALWNKDKLSDEMIIKYQSIVRYSYSDPIKPIIDEAVSDMEAICRPILSAKPTQ